MICSYERREIHWKKGENFLAFLHTRKKSFHLPRPPYDSSYFEWLAQTSLVIHGQSNLHKLIRTSYLILFNSYRHTYIDRQTLTHTHTHTVTFTQPRAILNYLMVVCPYIVAKDRLTTVDSKLQ